jgi:4-aminobutyrate aminotransferase-like enzyme
LPRSTSATPARPRPSTRDGRLTSLPSAADELTAYPVALAAILPSRINRIGFVATDEAAIDTALHLTQTATGRPGVLSFHSSFQRQTSAAASWLTRADPPLCEDHDAIDYATCEEPAQEAIAALALRGDLEDVGTVLVEPVLTTAGNLMPRRLFPIALRELCRERGWQLVVDESITGFGRTGQLFAFESVDVEPDVVVLGKGLGGAFPHSAVAANEGLWEAAALRGLPNRNHSGSLACAAGRAALEKVTESGFLERLRAVADHAAHRLRALASASPRVARPRGIGLMLGFNLVDRDTGRPASAAECEAVLRSCRERGVLVAAAVSRVRLTLPLTLSHAEADHLIDTISEVVG